MGNQKKNSIFSAQYRRERSGWLFLLLIVAGDVVECKREASVTRIEPNEANPNGAGTTSENIRVSMLGLEQTEETVEDVGADEGDGDDEPGEVANPEDGNDQPDEASGNATNVEPDEEDDEPEGTPCHDKMVKIIVFYQGDMTERPYQFRPWGYEPKVLDPENDNIPPMGFKMLVADKTKPLHSVDPGSGRVSSNIQTTHEYRILCGVHNEEVRPSFQTRQCTAKKDEDAAASSPDCAAWQDHYLGHPTHDIERAFPEKIICAGSNQWASGYKLLIDEPTWKQVRMPEIDDSGAVKPIDDGAIQTDGLCIKFEIGDIDEADMCTPDKWQKVEARLVLIEKLFVKEGETNAKLKEELDEVAKEKSEVLALDAEQSKLTSEAVKSPEVKALIDQKKELDESVEELKSEKEALIRDIDVIKQNQEKLETTAQTAANEELSDSDKQKAIENLREELTKSNEEEERQLKEEQANLNARMETYQKVIDQGEADPYTKMPPAVKTAVAAMKEQTTKQKQAKEELEPRLKELSDEIQRLEGEITSTEGEIEAVKQKHAATKKELEEVETRVDKKKALCKEGMPPAASSSSLLELIRTGKYVTRNEYRTRLRMEAQKREREENLLKISMLEKRSDVLVSEGDNEPDGDEANSGGDDQSGNNTTPDNAESTGDNSGEEELTLPGQVDIPEGECDESLPPLPFQKEEKRVTEELNQAKSELKAFKKEVQEAESGNNTKTGELEGKRKILRDLSCQSEDGDAANTNVKACKQHVEREKMLKDKKDEETLLDKLIEEEYPQLKFMISTVFLLAERGPEFIRMLGKVADARSAPADDKRKINYDKYVGPAGDGAEEQVTKDLAMMTQYCTLASCNGDVLAAAKAGKEPDNYVMGTMAKLKKAAETWAKVYAEDIENVIVSDLADGGSAKPKPHTGEAKANIAAEVETQYEAMKNSGSGISMIDSWMKQAQPPANGEEATSQDPKINMNTWGKYLNWVEDCEAAVRVLIKVTNRETKTEPNEMSNAVMACAEQAEGLLYTSDSKVRIADCATPPQFVPDGQTSSCPSPLNEKKCTASCDKHADWSKAHPKQVYGPFWGVYASSDATIHISQNLANEDVYGRVGATEYGHARHLSAVVRAAQNGYTVVLFGYGYSGAGKTYTLLGGGAATGVMTLGLVASWRAINRLSVRFKELYGIISLEDGRPEIGETGIFSYKINNPGGFPEADSYCPDDIRDAEQQKGTLTRDKWLESKKKKKICVQSFFWGRKSVPTTARKGYLKMQLPPDTSTEAKKLQADDEDMSMGFYTFMGEHEVVIKGQGEGGIIEIQAGKDVGHWINQAIEIIITTRLRMVCRDPKMPGNEICRHVRATPNNPESSRGHLFTILSGNFAPEEGDGEPIDGKIVIVDCAGSEDPVSIIKDYVGFCARWEGDMTPSCQFTDTRARMYMQRYEKDADTFWGLDNPDAALPSTKIMYWSLWDAYQWASNLPMKITLKCSKGGKASKATQAKTFKAGAHLTMNCIRSQAKGRAGSWCGNNQPVGCAPGQKGCKAKDVYDEWTEECQSGLIKLWEEEYLKGQGVVATVKEGVFINESLNHLKQFLLKRAGKLEKGVDVIKKGDKEIKISDKKAVVDVKVLTNPKTTGLYSGKAKDFEAFSKLCKSGKGGGGEINLPLQNQWDYYDTKRFNGISYKDYNGKWDASKAYYHPKQYIKPSDNLKYHAKGASNAQDLTWQNKFSLISSARCALEWEDDCEGMIVEGRAATADDLKSSRIQAFDPLIMMSMLNYFDKPQYFDNALTPAKKPTKFLMMAAIRREHPELGVQQKESDLDKKAQERLEAERLKKKNICMGTKMTLDFADQMNPLSVRTDY